MPFDSSLVMKGTWFPLKTFDFKGAGLSRIVLKVSQNLLGSKIDTGKEFVYIIVVNI